MGSELSELSGNLTLFDTDLNEINVKDPDTLYCRIENNLQELISIYDVYSPYNKDTYKLTNILDTIYQLHENCTFDIQEDYE